MPPTIPKKGKTDKPVDLGVPQCSANQLNVKSTNLSIVFYIFSYAEKYVFGSFVFYLDLEK